MTVYIRKNSIYYAVILYTLKIIEKNRGIEFKHTESIEKAEIIWDDQSDHSEPINLSFYQSLAANQSRLNHQNLLDGKLLIQDENGREDIIVTIFYMINCLQEINPDKLDLDQYGRFKFSASYQSKFDKIEDNLVEHLIDRFCDKHGIQGVKEKSTFFISHDIDSLYGSFLQDGFWALKRMKIGVILKLMIFELSRKPHWKNIDRIIKINGEYDVRTTFFWLVNKSKGHQGIKNADYNLSNERGLLEKVHRSGNTNGLHKSCSDMSIDEELEKGNLKTTYNRYHFLKFLPHTDWRKISDSKLDFDSSLGFSEHHGFRNSYGKAFQPFDIEANKPYDFIEAPLNFMDTTFHRYLDVPVNEIAETIINFYEKNPKNCNFSLLWHNAYFTSYKYNSFLEEYKKIVSFIHENEIECIGPQELIEKNKLEW